MHSKINYCIKWRYLVLYPVWNTKMPFNEVCHVTCAAMSLTPYSPETYLHFLSSKIDVVHRRNLRYESEHKRGVNSETVQWLAHRTCNLEAMGFARGSSSLLDCYILAGSDSANRYHFCNNWGSCISMYIDVDVYDLRFTAWYSDIWSILPF